MINRSSWWWKSCGVAIALSFVIPNVAQANFLIGTIAGNDCSGIYGQPPNCTVPIYDGEGNPILDEEGNQTYSPLIAKFDLTGGVFVFTPGIYDSIDGNEFSFNFDGGPSGADGLNGTGSWTYNPGADDPPVLMFTAKGGPNFNLFVNTGGNTDNYYMPTNPNNGKPYGFSHIVFFDSGDGGPTQQIPESGVLFLIGAGVLGLALSRRRRA